MYLPAFPPNDNDDDNTNTKVMKQARAKEDAGSSSRSICFFVCVMYSCHTWQFSSLLGHWFMLLAGRSHMHLWVAPACTDNCLSYGARDEKQNQ